MTTKYSGMRASPVHGPMSAPKTSHGRASHASAGRERRCLCRASQDAHSPCVCASGPNGQTSVHAPSPRPASRLCQMRVEVAGPVATLAPFARHARRPDETPRAAGADDPSRRRARPPGRATLPRQECAHEAAPRPLAKMAPRPPTHKMSTGCGTRRIAALRGPTTRTRCAQPQPRWAHAMGTASTWE